MYIPVEFRPSVERGVYPREEVSRERGGEVLVREMVQRKGEDDLVEVKRERLQAQIFGHGLDILGRKGCWRRNGKRIVHLGW